MCKFFSCNSDGGGELFYFNWELRKKMLSGEIKNYEPDSHTSIADYFGYKGEKEDSMNKYEYNPLTGKFVIDQLNTTDDNRIVQKQLDNFDWKTIVEPLIIKPIIHPFEMDAPEITPEIVDLVKKWASVRDSTRNSAKASVRDSTRNSAWASVWDSVWNSVGDSVGDSVWHSIRVSAWASVWNAVWDSVWHSVWDSVWYSVRAYFSSFFDIDYGYDFSPVVRLWEIGLVSSFDGKLWRLHGKPNGKVLWEGNLT